jgi:CheY-like chemotaxis protein
MARILIVDDEPNTLSMLAQTMIMLGHEPITAADGFSALGTAINNSPDVILLDLMMPGIDGHETLRRLRETAKGCDIPVVVLTASQEGDLAERVIRAGGNYCLRKPAGLAALEQTLRQALAVRDKVLQR